ncbi:MAG TPA: flavin reductase family protein [Thermomicrobiales bacterium]|nr:flavin reductase family protein [Thermomicrobiales bacterium]
MSPVVNRADFFATMGAFPTGVTVVTSIDEYGHPRGLTCNAFSSVSADPPLLMACLDHRSSSLDAIRESGRFVVNFLGAASGAVADRFAGKHPDKFCGIRWETSLNGMPILVDDAIAYAACRVVDAVDAGDHTILIGLVEEAHPPEPEREPLVYFRRAFGVVQPTVPRRVGPAADSPRVLRVSRRPER